MVVSIQDIATQRVVLLAEEESAGLTETTQPASPIELGRLDDGPPLHERIATIRRGVIARGRTRECADKAFFDDLSGDL